MLTIPVTALADAKVTIALSGDVTPSQVTKVTVLGTALAKPALTVEVDKPAGAIPANSNVTFALQNLATTAGASITVTVTGTSGTPQTTKVALKKKAA
jgi:hypothetical protein